MTRWIWGLSFWCMFLSSTQASSFTFKRVVMIVFENENYQNVLGQPFFAQLAKQGAQLGHFTAEAHPSQPNYIAMVAGDTLGVSSDSNVDLSATHVGDLLEKAGKTWKVYAEGYPGNCYTGQRQGNYVRKHLPFISFTNVQNDARRCANIQDGTHFMSDARAGKLPEFSLYIPDMKNDGHDTGVAYADRWFRQAFGALLQDPKFLQDTLFVVTFDESEMLAPVNQIYTVLLGSGVVAGSSSDQPYNHYSLLRTFEEGLGLGTLNRKDQSAAVVSGVWK